MSATKRPCASEPGSLPWAIAGLLLVAIGIIYGQTLTFDFLGYDDQVFVTQRPQVRAGLTGEGIAWAFTNGPGEEWYPLAMLSHMLDCQLYGLRPAGHFLTNLLLHAATVVGLFFTLRQMTGELWPSVLVAALLAVHPQHVESVAWIAERRDVLSGLFFVLTLAAYTSYVHHGRSPGRYLLVAALLALGLMSKAMLVTVPALLLLLDDWPLGRFGHASDLPPRLAGGQSENFGRLAIEKLPLAAIALADAAVTLVTHAQAAPMAWSDRAASALTSLMAYLEHALYPVGLSAFYPYAEPGEPAWKVVGSLATLSALSAAAVLARRKCPYLFVGWFWFLGMMVPVLGLVQISAHAMADRYMYLPAIGLYIAVSFGAWRIAEGSVAGRRALGAGVAIVLILLIGSAMRQTSYWHDGERLWCHAIAATGSTMTAEGGLAEFYRAAGRQDEAAEHFQRAVERGNHPDLLLNYGTILFEQRKYAEAEQIFRRALAAHPGSAVVASNLGAVLAEQGRTQEAIGYYLAAIDLDAKLLLPRQNLVRLLAQHGKFDEAAVQCRAALEIVPDDPLARKMLADLLKAQAGESIK